MRKIALIVVMLVWTAEVFSNETSKIVLEEPVDSGVSSGIGNIRGWVISDSGVDRVELFVNGQYQANIPFGGQRKDVERAYPHVPNSINSGFGQTFNFGELGYGQHRITVRAYLGNGLLIEDTAYFKASVLPVPFVPESEKPNLSVASISVDKTTGEIRLTKVELSSGERLDLRLEWSTPEQGFSLVEVTDFEFPGFDECDGSDGDAAIDCFSKDTSTNGYGLTSSDDCAFVDYWPLSVELECNARGGIFEVLISSSEFCNSGPGIILRDPAPWYEMCNLDGTEKEGW